MKMYKHWFDDSCHLEPMTTKDKFISVLSLPLVLNVAVMYISLCSIATAVEVAVETVFKTFERCKR